jgi:hypothetical protein
MTPWQEEGTNLVSVSEPYCGQCTAVQAYELDRQGSCFRSIVLECTVDGFGGAPESSCFTNQTDGRVVQVWGTSSWAKGWAVASGRDCPGFALCSGSGPGLDAGSDGADSPP